MKRNVLILQLPWLLMERNVLIFWECNLLNSFILKYDLSSVNLYTIAKFFSSMWRPLHTVNPLACHVLVILGIKGLMLVSQSRTPMCHNPRWGLSMANESLLKCVRACAYLFIEHRFFCFEVAFWSMIQTFLDPACQLYTWQSKTWPQKTLFCMGGGTSVLPCVKEGH